MRRSPVTDTVALDNWHDFDNNGYQDLVVGLPFEDVNGQADAGAVQVIYATDLGAGSAAPSNQFWTQDSAPSGQVAMPEAAEAGDHFGWATAVGDFNGDGYGDLAIGVPDEDDPPRPPPAFRSPVAAPAPDGLGTSPDSGLVQILYGSAAGLRTTRSLSGPGAVPDYISFGNVANSGAPVRLGAALTSLDAWDDVAAGSAADGYADLAIGIPGADVPDPVSMVVADDAGGALLIAGTSTGIGVGRPSTTSAVLCGFAAGDRCGSVLAAGDLAGSQFLAVGTPLHDFPGAANAGAVWVAYAPFDVGTGTAATTVMYAQGGGGAGDTREAGDKFGAALAAGDFNGNTGLGYDELAVGVPLEDVATASGTKADGGIVQIFSGGPAGLSATPTQLWSQDVNGVLEDVDAGDRFGSALAAGVFDGPAYYSLAIGVPREDLGSIVDAGVVHVLYGSPAGLTAMGADFLKQGRTAGSAGPAVGDRPEAGDRFGSALAVPDQGENSWDDLSIGVPFEDVTTTSGTVADAGIVHVLYGSAAGLDGTDCRCLLRQGVNGIKSAPRPGDRFGGVLY